MVVDSDREDFLRAVLVDDVFIEVFLDDVGLDLGKLFVEGHGEVFLLHHSLLLVIFFNKMIDFPDAAFADRKAGTGIVNWHIVLVMDRDIPLAEAALDMLGFLFRHSISSFP